MISVISCLSSMGRDNYPQLFFVGFVFFVVHILVAEFRSIVVIASFIQGFQAGIACQLCNDEFPIRTL